MYWTKYERLPVLNKVACSIISIPIKLAFKLQPRHTKRLDTFMACLCEMHWQAWNWRR